jgi:large subunit ribosomal protein L24
MKIKKNDTVLVIAGKEKGKKGLVIEADPKKRRVRIEGINILKKHIKPRQPGERGSIVEKPGYVHISNVMFVDSQSGQPTRVNYQIVDGKKIRFSRKLNKEL